MRSSLRCGGILLAVLALSGAAADERRLQGRLRGLAAAAQEGSVPRRQGARPIQRREPAAGAANLKISFKIRHGEMERAGNFVVQEANQSNYVIGGSIPFEVSGAKGARTIEFKNHGAIVNCLIQRDAADPSRAEGQFQFELSGPVRSKNTDVTREVATFQFQTQARLRLGEPLVLVDEAENRVEVTVELHGS